MAGVEEFETLSEKLASATLARDRLVRRMNAYGFFSPVAELNPDSQPPLNAESGTLPGNDRARTEMSVPEKIALFRRFFRGREDVYALRFEGPGDKSGYFPAGIRDWKALSGLSQSERRKRDKATCKLLPHRDGVHFLIG